MRRIHILSSALIACLIATSTAAAQQRPVEVAPNAPRDKAVEVAYQCQWTAALKAMEPMVAKARATYPDARRRFLAGLPARHTMFVTVRLSDEKGRSEQVFVAVDSIVGSQIVGRIWSDLHVVSGYRRGQRREVEEGALVDWMIARPDGTEEGNVVGNFMDTYVPPKSCETQSSDR